MRWCESQENPKEFNTRSIRRFLLFPLLLNGEWRWLEYADIIQEYSRVGDMYAIRGYHLDWVNARWEDKR
jgi:hypothetical protein